MACDLGRFRIYLPNLHVNKEVHGQGSERGQPRSPSHRGGGWGGAPAPLGAPCSLLRGPGLRRSLRPAAGTEPRAPLRGEAHPALLPPAAGGRFPARRPRRGRAAGRAPGTAARPVLASAGRRARLSVLGGWGEPSTAPRRPSCTGGRAAGAPPEPQAPAARPAPSLRGFAEPLVGKISHRTVWVHSAGPGALSQARHFPGALHPIVKGRRARRSSALQVTKPKETGGQVG